MTFGSNASYAPLFEQAYDNATFLALLRRQAFDQPNMLHKDVTELEQRMDNAMELLLGWPELSWPYCEAGLSYEEYGEAFVAAVVAFQTGDDLCIEKIVSLCATNTNILEGVQYALTWLSPALTKPWLERLLASKDLEHKRLAVAVYILIGKEPGQVLTNMLHTEACVRNTPLLALCLRLIANIKQQDLLKITETFAKNRDEGVYFEALRASALLGGEVSSESFQIFIKPDFPHYIEAMYLFFGLADTQAAKRFISKLAADPASRRLAIEAMASYGDPHTIPWLLNIARELKWARLAGQAFYLITGLNIESHGLAVETTPSIEDGEVDDEASFEDEYLPWPDVAKITTHWQLVSAHYQPGQRYFLGNVISCETLEKAMHHAPMRYTHLAALLFAMEKRDAHVRPTRKKRLA